MSEMEKNTVVENAVPENTVEENTMTEKAVVEQRVEEAVASDSRIEDSTAEKEQEDTNAEYSLNDDRRVKTLSPGAMVAKRFFRNSIAVLGMVVLLAMFLFSFLGGAISPYKESQLFYRKDVQSQKYAGVKVNTELRYQQAEKDAFPALAQAQFVLARGKKETEFKAGDKEFTYEEAGKDFYIISVKGTSDPVAFAAIDLVTATGAETPSFAEQLNILKAYSNKESSFTLDGANYTIAEDGTVSKDGKEYATAGRYVINTIMSDVKLSEEFKEKLLSEIQADSKSFTYQDADGKESVYNIEYDAPSKAYNIRQTREQMVYDTYSAPSKAHPLGTDKNGMDMLTRLMYGGRVSLYIGFVVVIIETIIGMIMGGISGYFGGWVDNLIMRIVDVFYCIPTIPIYIIIGAAMDALRVDPKLRMFYLMLILGFFGWPSITRLVRGQILTLREQEFMTATEATGIKPVHRIFRHLLPNVIPQLIVTCTMSLGGVILTEAVLSFLGLGVKFPFASWGNIINDVNNTYVLSNYLFIWVPAGVCLLLTVLAFNLVGDGLRDAFDPKMKR